VLGEAAIVLHRVACALDSVRSRLTEHGAGFFETEQRARPYEDLKQLGHEIEALADRLSVKLGREHEATAAFASARVAVQDIVEALGRLSDPDRHGALGLQKLADETIEHVEDQRTRLDACRNRFMDAMGDAPGKE